VYAAVITSTWSTRRRMRATAAATWAGVACGRSGRCPTATFTPWAGLNPIRRSSTASRNTNDNTITTSAAERGDIFFFNSTASALMCWRRIAVNGIRPRRGRICNRRWLRYADHVAGPA
jgi:hypothetical protein